MDVSKMDEVLNYFYERKDYKLCPFNEKGNFTFPETEFYRIVRNLKDDNYLGMTSTGNLTTRVEDNEFRISTFGERFKEDGGFAAEYHKLSVEAARSEEKENLQLQELKTNVRLLTSQLTDYDKVRDNAKWAIRVAWIAAALSAGQLLLSQLRP
jgi:hypothetical protein